MGLLTFRDSMCYLVRCLQSIASSGVVGRERGGTPFPHFFSGRERDPSLFCSISGIFEYNMLQITNSFFLHSTVPKIAALTLCKILARLLFLLQFLLQFPGVPPLHF